IFITEGHADFTPKLPDQRRAQVLFSETNNNLFIHPTQAAGEGVASRSSRHVSSRYYTGNGVCACATAGECQFNIAGSDVCGFLDTVKSLHDGEWRPSRVFDNKQCIKQVDWPYTGGKMRDGSPLPNNVDASGQNSDVLPRNMCGLLSRHPVYEYRYKANVIYPAPDGAPTTLSSSGDCHTGRLANTNTDDVEITSDCALLHRNTSHLILECGTDTLTLPRMMSDVPLDVMRRVHNLRRGCDQCSAAPTFHSPDGSKLPDAESSVTHPYRISTQRMLASELRNDLSRAMCDSLDGCPEFDAVINRSHWVPDMFWNAFMGDVRVLLNNTLTPTQPMPSIGTTFEGSSNNEGYTENDVDLWERPWVLCRQGAPTCDEECDGNVCSLVCTNAALNTNTCQGTMDREAWINPSTRVAATIATFLQVLEDQGAESMVEDMNVCDLDATLSELCQTVQTARGAVFHGNCLAAGECLHEVFFYQPSMYSLSNNQFVRQTVEQFYQHIHPRACDAHKNARKLETQAQNAQLVEQCAATTLEHFKTMLGNARSSVGSLIRACYFTGMIMMHAVRLMMPPLDFSNAQADRDDAKFQMGVYLDLMIQELSEMFAAGIELVMSTLLGSDSGRFIESLVQGVCEAINWIVKIFYIDLFCEVRKQLVHAINEVITSLDPITSISIAGWLPFEWLSMQGLLDIRTQLLLSNCDEADNMKTCIRVDNPLSQPTPRIDVATRCWSTYVNSLGDASSLSCSAADSCLQYDSNAAFVENGLVACDDCPYQHLEDFQRFGCDIVRKQCKCNVQTISRTACINHAQCQSTDAQCDMLDNAFSSASFGTTPCKSCSSGPSLCIDAPGGARCACPLRNQAFQTCRATSISDIIVPDPNGLCLVTLGSGTQQEARRSSEYSISYAELAAAPCAILDTSQTFCFNVHSADWVLAPFIVGVERLSVGRRLLEVNAGTTVEGMLHIAAHDLERVAALSWESVVDEGCRLVGPRGYLSGFLNLSVSDQVLYKGCVRWRAIGDDVRRSFNLTVPDTFLLSMTDLAQGLSDPAVAIRIVSHPEIVVYTLLHSEAAAPVRAFIRSVRVWFAHSLAYLIDHSHWLHEQLDDMRNATESNTTDPDLNTTGPNITRHRTHTTHSLLLELRRAAPMPHHSPRMDTDTDDDAVYDTYQEDNDDQEEDISRDVPQDSAMAHQRNLLTFQKTLDDVKTYSTKLALGDGATQLMGGALSNAFQNIPIPFSGIALESGCAVVSETSNVIIDSFKLFGMFFTKKKSSRQYVERDVLMSFPTFDTTYRDPDSKKKYSIEPVHNSVAGSISRFIFERVGGMEPNYVRDVIASIPEVFKRIMRCNIDSVMFCSEFRYSLFSGAIVVAILLYIGGIILASLGIPYVWTGLAIIYVPVVLFYSLGYSPLCIPMIPTCIGDEIISTLDLLLPARVQWPQALQQSTNCIDNLNISTSRCVVSCSAHPFNFRGWYECAAWSLCELNIDACIGLHDWLRTKSFAATPDAILFDASSALWRSHMIIKQADVDTISAFRLCAMLTSWRLVPLIFLVVIVVYTTPVLFLMPLQLVISGLQVAMTALAMSHTHVREPRRE
ncbi:hypothetical protein T484DRAFT_1756981, partial [Baffinella frigidus]